ncbi:MAG: aspartate-alanine antiporter [Muribaculaceae bacterium]|nr:aspartate-alanine antiporter [Muribaculaceae bacterium]
MDWFAEILRNYPAIAVFLTVGIGFGIGRLKYKSFTLGSVTAVLLIGLLIGQLDIPISDQIKNLFFMMFLFSIGYSVGPKFFSSLKGVGLKQALFAVAMSFSCFGVTVLVAHLFHYSAGETVGLFSGSQTCSSLLGVGAEAIQNQPGTPEYKTAQLNIIPICYAVTYIYGTLGTVIILSSVAPRLLGGLENVRKQTAKLEALYDTSAWHNDPAYISAGREVAFRAYKANSAFFNDGATVSATESYLRDKGLLLFIDRVQSHTDGAKLMATPNAVIHKGDTVVISGRREFMVKIGRLIGAETSSISLLNFPVKQVPVLLKNRKVVGRSIKDLAERSFMRGVIIKDVSHDGKSIKPTPDLVLNAGDTLTIVGARKLLNKAATHLGHVDRPSIHTDIMFMALALFIGGSLGTVTFMFDSIPISFGTSGGSLIAGLVFGWLRSRRPTYGHIPRSVLWFMNQMGLNVFIAVVGLSAAPSFMMGIRTVGPLLLVAGVITTTAPLLIGLWLGHKVFKFNPAFTLGCCAGTRTCTAALGAVQDTLGSSLPTIGYTVTYAVSNVLLILWGLFAVILA